MASKTSDDSDRAAKKETLHEKKRNVHRRINAIKEDMVQGKTAAAEEALEKLATDLEATFQDLREQVDDSLEPSRAVIREQPIVSVGTALGAGVLAGLVLGLLLERGKD